MRFFWRSVGDPLPGYASWLGRIDVKNREPGTSAPTLAAAWSGPLDLLGALAKHPSLVHLTVHRVAVEEKAPFDAYGGNVRNHDLVLRASTVDGDSIVVCVEAKAGEPLGATVAQQIMAAERAKRANARSKASARVADLVERLCRFPSADPRVASLRYQLLTAWAGTLADADGAAHAVFALHEFRTDERPEDKSGVNGAELSRFGDSVLGWQLPDSQTVPWCVRVPDRAGVSAALYVAHVVTDLRASTVLPPATKESSHRP
ncbi:MAG: hypothetical protein ABSH51_29655 [Solirubrobacteraceae bacterium]|jgi:hypothetical protein